MKSSLIGIALVSLVASALAVAQTTTTQPAAPAVRKPPSYCEVLDREGPEKCGSKQVMLIRPRSFMSSAVAEHCELKEQVVVLPSNDTGSPFVICTKK